MVRLLTYAVLIKYGFQVSTAGRLQNTVLLPALAHARERQLITAQEEAVLHTTIRAGTVKAGDLEAPMPGLNAGQRTYQIRKLAESGMLQPVREGARQYTLNFLRCSDGDDRL